METVRNTDGTREISGQPIESLLDEREVARWIHVSVATLRFWRAVDRGPRYRKIGQMVRYAPSDVREWLNSRPSGGEGVGEEASHA